MRGVLLRSAMVVLIVAMFGGHVTELFDHWDHTLRSGADSDYLVVVIAASISLGLVGLQRVAAVVLPSCSVRPAARQMPIALQFAAPEAAVAGPSPPLIAIRI